MPTAEAKLYSKNKDSSVDCFLCRHRCHISEGNCGICMVRQNCGGALMTLFYGEPVAAAVDPIEKKPLFHFLPASKAFSIATLGCNFQCPFCQNWDISQYGRNGSSMEKSAAGRYVSPESIVQSAREAGCASIAYTYSEPTIFFEYAYDIALEAEKFGIKNIFVTNGYMTREAVDTFHPHLHAANIDLKAFDPKTYHKEMKADLEGVLDTIRYMSERGIWIEITTLVVPNMNDSDEELRGIAKFIASVDKGIPWHISRFHPAFKSTVQAPTPQKTMDRAFNIGKKAGLKYVYLGNVTHDERENTFCYSCGKKLIERNGFSVVDNLLDTDSKCPGCASKIDGVFR